MNAASRVAWQENMPLLYCQFQCKLIRYPCLSSCFIQDSAAGDSDTSFVAVSTLLPNEASKVALYKTEIKSFCGSETNHCKTFSDGFGFDDDVELVDTYKFADCDTHKLRGSSKDPTLLAAASSSGLVHIFNVSSTEGLALKCSLASHSRAVWGLSWSRFNSQLVSSSDDGSICLWDLQQEPLYTLAKDVPKYTPLQKFSYDSKSAVQTVATSVEQPCVFYSGDDASNLILWDTRVSDASHAGFPLYSKASAISFNSISNNPFRPWLLATGSNKTKVDLWDMRMCGLPIANLAYHSNSVNTVEWNNQFENLLVSASHDARVIIWDISSIGKEQSEELNEDGPSELIFTHAGHLLPVQDVTWHYSPRHPYSLSSVCDGGMWMNWSVNPGIFVEEDEYDEYLSEEGGDPSMFPTE